MSLIWTKLADIHFKYFLLSISWPGDDPGWELSQHLQNYLDRKAGIKPRGGSK